MKKAVSNLRRLWDPETPATSGGEILGQSLKVVTDDDALLWFENLLRWLSKESRTPGKYVRFKLLFQLLDSNPDWKTSFVKQTSRLFKKNGFLLRFLLETGFSNDRGLLQEAAKRTVARLLPVVRSGDLFEVVADVFHDQEDRAWFESIPTETIQCLTALFLSSEESQALARAFRSAASEALQVFLIRVADLGLTPEIRDRTRLVNPSGSPFLILSQSMMSALSSAAPTAVSDVEFAELFQLCEQAIQMVYEDMEQNGASVGLVYRLEVMSAALSRIQHLSKLALSTTLDSTAESKDVHQLFASSVAGLIEGRSIVGHIRQQTHLLSRKIAERNGVSGDHYIARSSDDRKILFRSALKGGAIVLVMTLMKMSLHSGDWHLPALPEAILIWIIYSGGFIAMQLTDSTLATKLPSFTASRLAVLMNRVRHAEDLDLFVKEIKTVIGSQALALFGNIAALIPLAIVFNWGFEQTFGRPAIESHYAAQTLAGLHPIFSLAVFFGALTGVLLWISSLAGGWFENWVVYLKLPAAIESHRRLRRVLGASRPKRLAAWLQANASGLSANIVLGFLFGFVPFVGSITGLPIDSRHVTISSASAALSGVSMRSQPDLVYVISMALIGLLFIGIMNLVVSFSLALIVAARASSVDPRRFRMLILLIRRRLIGF